MKKLMRTYAWLLQALHSSHQKYIKKHEAFLVETNNE
jgi:hypothetical protein